MNFNNVPVISKKYVPKGKQLKYNNRQARMCQMPVLNDDIIQLLYHYSDNNALAFTCKSMYAIYKRYMQYTPFKIIVNLAYDSNGDDYTIKELIDIKLIKSIKVLNLFKIRNDMIPTRVMLNITRDIEHSIDIEDNYITLTSFIMIDGGHIAVTSSFDKYIDKLTLHDMFKLHTSYNCYRCNVSIGEDILITGIHEMGHISVFNGLKRMNYANIKSKKTEIRKILSKVMSITERTMYDENYDYTSITNEIIAVVNEHTSACRVMYYAARGFFD